jgi:hypothetical protein
VLTGIIHENTVKSALIADVPVSAQGANPTALDCFGQFTLQFPHKRIGEAVQMLLRKDRLGVTSITRRVYYEDHSSVTIS